MSNNSILPIDRALSVATSLGQIRPGSNGNERVIHILQSPMAGALPSDSLMSYLWGCFTSLQRCSWCILFDNNHSFAYWLYHFTHSYPKLIVFKHLFDTHMGRFPRCNDYHLRKWIRRHEFKFWTRLICISRSTCGKGMNPTILPPPLGK